ncbi:MAG: aminodeoxychorismate lyase [Gammaproteobacteria bacterium]
MILINGHQSSLISAEDRGLLYGDGLFETLAVFNGQPRLWDRHMRRLCLGCVRLGIPSPDLTALRAEALVVCQSAPQAVLKIIVTRGSAQRGYRGLSATNPTRIVALYPWFDYPADFEQHGIAVRVCTTRLGSNPALAGIKHLNRLEQVLARNEWDDPAIPEGIMLDGQGQVIEGTMSNIFMVCDGRLLTPDLSQCGVAGIMRELILETAVAMALPATITVLSLNEMMNAQEIFLCNSLIGLWPVHALAETRFPVGPVTRCMAARLNELLNTC